MRHANCHLLKGEEKEGYLKRLDTALEAVAQEFSSSLSEERIPAHLKEVAQLQQWDESRLPILKGTNKTLSQLMQKVQKEYRWFGQRLSSEEPLENYAYFEQLEVSADSGLPWVFSLLELQRLRQNASGLQQKLPEYTQLAKELRELLAKDYVPLNEVDGKARELQQQALKRNFLTLLPRVELLGWDAAKQCTAPLVQKTLSLGGEELWHLAFMQYHSAEGLFEAYLIDAWQERRKPVFQEKNDGCIELPKEFLDSLKFGRDNASWYILRNIDEKFSHLHPVKVSRFLVGPFENCYSTSAYSEMPRLPITAELLKEDPACALLRLSHQYTYAPNHEEVDGKLRQVIYREDWSDEYIIAPAKFAPRVADSVLGTRVKVLEYNDNNQ
ncbi:MAG: hypothetical protein AABY26_01765 [Nanoarchaeota archaeon]